jgi:hypothetical protein
MRRRTNLWAFGAVLSVLLLFFIDATVRGGTVPTIAPTASPLPTFNASHTHRNPFIAVQAQQTPAPKRSAHSSNIALTGVFDEAGSTPLASFQVNGVDTVAGEGDTLSPTPVRVVKIRSTSVTLSNGDTLQWQPVSTDAAPIIQTITSPPPGQSIMPIEQHTPMPGGQPTPLAISSGAQ